MAKLTTLGKLNWLRQLRATQSSLEPFLISWVPEPSCEPTKPSHDITNTTHPPNTIHTRRDIKIGLYKVCHRFWGNAKPGHSGQTNDKGGLVVVVDCGIYAGWRGTWYLKNRAVQCSEGEQPVSGVMTTWWQLCAKKKGTDEFLELVQCPMSAFSWSPLPLWVLDAFLLLTLYCLKSSNHFNYAP